MTVIAYRDGVMAADSNIVNGNIVIGEAVKIKRLHGCLVGCSGTWASAAAFFDWFEKNGTISRPPADVKIEASDDWPVSVLIVKGRKVYCIDGTGHPYEVKGPYFAIGSGAAVALGAMFAGADARQAIQAAIRHDKTCGGRVIELAP